MPYNMIYYNELLILLQLDYFLENSKKYSKYRSMILQVCSKEEKGKKLKKGKKTRGTTTKRIVGSRLSTIIRGIGVEINHNAGKFEPIIRNRNWPARWPPMEMDY